MVSPQVRREAVDALVRERGLRLTRACGLVGISRSLYSYRSRRPADAELSSRIGDIAAEKRRYGYRRIHVLLRREGRQINHKRTYRLYREAGLAVRRRKRKRIGPLERKPLAKPTEINVSWSMDFVADGLVDGRKLRCLTIVDDCSRECPVIEVDTSIDVVPEFRTVWSWTKLALKFPTRGDKEHEGRAVYGRADHLRTAPG
jgi:putative transposase